MQTMSIPRFGGPEVLTAVEKQEPRPGPGEVSLDVAYAGLNSAEVLFRSGVAPGPERSAGPRHEQPPRSGHALELML
jgi:NADPH:quinone reductase